MAPIGFIYTLLAVFELWRGYSSMLQETRDDALLAEIAPTPQLACFASDNDQ
jgi:hypothetical protein